MKTLDSLPITDMEAASNRRDFTTCEDEMPTAVILRPGGPVERGKYITDVKYETTDDK